RQAVRSRAVRPRCPDGGAARPQHVRWPRRDARRANRRRSPERRAPSWGPPPRSDRDVSVGPDGPPYRFFLPLLPFAELIAGDGRLAGGEIDLEHLLAF